MKNKFSILALAAIASFAAPAANAAAILAQTSFDEWSVSRNLELVSGTTASGSVTSSALGGVLSVSQYTGAEELVRVVITVVQPDTSVSPTIGASITIASGSDTFTSVTTDNRVTETTKVRFSNGLESSLSGVGVSVNDPAYNTQKNSGNYANATIEVGTPILRSLSVANASTTIFDSQVEGLTGAQLASIFAGVGTVGFGFEATSDFRWTRTGTETLTATLSGINSGRVTIQYWVVPEPSAALLGGLGVLALLRRRR